MTDNKPTLSDIKSRKVQDASDDAVLRAEFPDNLMDNKRLEIQLESLKQDVEARKTYAPKLYELAVFWIVVVVGIVLLQGITLHSFFRQYISFNLSDKVLITLISTTTLSVLGLLHFALKYIFSTHRDTH